VIDNHALPVHRQHLTRVLVRQGPAPPVDQEVFTINNHTLGIHGQRPVGKGAGIQIIANQCGSGRRDFQPGQSDVCYGQVEYLTTGRDPLLIQPDVGSTQRI
jgi:hypothetical protein